jgi:O-acetyl-ADP-ribose deacetylase
VRLPLGSKKITPAIPKNNEFRAKKLCPIAWSTRQTFEVNIEVALCHITKQELDVVVNTAYSSLLGDGGVDDAIHRAAGPVLIYACFFLGGCKTGDAKITEGFQLRTHWIVHTVGPVWRSGGEGEPELLAARYRRLLNEGCEGKCTNDYFSIDLYGEPKRNAGDLLLGPRI